jgi:uncharacterized protein YdaU (DUF1376 family)
MTKDTKPDAWMPLYIGDWEGDTGHLDCEQDGAYGRMIRWYWRNGPLPDDDVKIARIIRMDLKRWRKVREVLSPFFVISGGAWRHGRVEKELERWEGKRSRAIERAAAGGRAKAEKKRAYSTQQAVLNGCTSASSTEVDGLTGQSTLCGQVEFIGPKEVRDAFEAVQGDEWCRAYLDPCGWQDVPERALIPKTAYAGKKLLADARATLLSLGVSVQDRAA